jgi:hypothetical protein
MRVDWASRLKLFQDGFQALDADVIALQETVLAEEVDQAAEMLGGGNAARSAARMRSPTHTNTAAS